jgi:hypothetical protein
MLLRGTRSSARVVGEAARPRECSISAGQGSPPDSGCRLHEPELPENHLRGGPAASPVGNQGSEAKVPGFLDRREQKRSDVLVEALAGRSAEQEHAFALVVVVDGDPGPRTGLVGRRGKKDGSSSLGVPGTRQHRDGICGRLESPGSHAHIVPSALSHRGSTSSRRGIIRLARAVSWYRVQGKEGAAALTSRRAWMGLLSGAPAGHGAAPSAGVDVAIGVLAVVAMLATLAVTLFLLAYWINVWHQAPRAARRRGIALVAAGASLWTPDVALFLTQPWGRRTDGAVFLIYTGLIALRGLALGVARTARSTRSWASSRAASCASRRAEAGVVTDGLGRGLVALGCLYWVVLAPKR